MAASFHPQEEKSGGIVISFPPLSLAAVPSQAAIFIPDWKAAGGRIEASILSFFFRVTQISPPFFESPLRRRPDPSLPLKFLSTEEEASTIQEASYPATFNRRDKKEERKHRRCTVETNDTHSTPSLPLPPHNDHFARNRRKRKRLPFLISFRAHSGKSNCRSASRLAFASVSYEALPGETSPGPGPRAPPAKVAAGGPWGVKRHPWGTPLHVWGLGKTTAINSCFCGGGRRRNSPRKHEAHGRPTPHP